MEIYEQWARQRAPHPPPPAQKHSKRCVPEVDKGVRLVLRGLRGFAGHHIANHTGLTNTCFRFVRTAAVQETQSVTAQTKEARQHRDRTAGSQARLGSVCTVKALPAMAENQQIHEKPRSNSHFLGSRSAALVWPSAATESRHPSTSGSSTAAAVATAPAPAPAAPPENRNKPTPRVPTPASLVLIIHPHETQLAPPITFLEELSLEGSPRLRVSSFLHHPPAPAPVHPPASLNPPSRGKRVRSVAPAFATASVGCPRPLSEARGGRTAVAAAAVRNSSCRVIRGPRPFLEAGCLCSIRLNR